MNTHNTERMSLAVEGMTCGSCVSKVEAALAPIQGVSEVAVDFTTNTVSFHQAPPATLAEIVAAIEAAGYHTDATVHYFQVEGMTCGKCEAKIEKVTTASNGALEAKANRHTKTLTVVGDIDPAEVVAAVNAENYTATYVQHTGQATDAAEDNVPAEPAACEVSAEPVSAEQTQESEHTYSLPVEGMTCASCVGRVEAALNSMQGVSNVSVNLVTNKAQFQKDNNVALDEVVKAVEKAGYSVPAETYIFDVEGMTCASCVGRVEAAATSVSGAVEAKANLATERVTVTSRIDPVAVEAAIQKIGYAAKLSKNTGVTRDFNAKKDEEAKGLKRHFWIAILLTLPVFVLEMGAHAVPAFHRFIESTIGTQMNWYIQFALATAV